MSQLVNQTTIVPIELAEGHRIAVEVLLLDDEEDVALRVPTLRELTQPIGALVSSLGAALSGIEAEKVTVEVGLDIGMEAGQLVALVARGSANASVRLILEDVRRAAGT